MEIIRDLRNDLLKRQEVSVLVEAEKNPGFGEMKKKVSEQIGKPEENINVYNVKGSFGSHEFKVDAYVYDSKEDLEKAVKKKKEKEAGKKEVKIEEKPAEEEIKEEEKAEKEPEQEEKAVEEEPEVKEGAEPLAEEEAKEP